MNKETEMQGVLKDMLLQLKSEGLRVFQADPQQTKSAYGFISDGKDVVVVWYDASGLHLSYEYVPSKENGYGVSLNDFQNSSGKIDRKMFEQAVAEGRRYAYLHGAELLSDKHGQAVVEHHLAAYFTSNYKEL